MKLVPTVQAETPQPYYLVTELYLPTYLLKNNNKTITENKQAMTDTDVMAQTNRQKI